MLVALIYIPPDRYAWGIFSSMNIASPGFKEIMLKK